MPSWPPCSPGGGCGCSGSGRGSPRRRPGAQRIAFREDTHFHASRLLPVVRGALLEAGVRLARAGVLDDPADVWHLRWSELTAIADPDQLPPAQREPLRTVVAERSAQREAYGGAPLVSPATCAGRTRSRTRW